MLFFLTFLETLTKIVIYSLILSQNNPEMHKNGTFLSKLVKISMYYFILGQKHTMKVTLKLQLLLKSVF